MRKEYILETFQLGNSVKVTAIDPETSLEATIVGPLNAMPKDLEKLAIKKLEYIIRKQ